MHESWLPFLGDTTAQQIATLTPIVALFVSIWAVWLVRGTLKASRDAVSVANATLEETTRIGEAQARAYLNVDCAAIYWNGKSMRDPEIILTIRNSGQTPAKWFEVATACRAFQRPSSFSDIFEAGFSEEKSFTRWHTIDAGRSLTLPVNDNEATLAIGEGHRLRETHGLTCVGIVRYATIFDEIFETEFNFFCPIVRGFRPREVLERQRAVMPDESELAHAFKDMTGGTITDKITVEEPIEMSRGTIPLQTYVKVDVHSPKNRL